MVNPYTCTVLPLDEMTGVERPLGFIPTPRAIQRRPHHGPPRALRVAGGPSPCW